jgi:hypothetical protein
LGLEHKQVQELHSKQVLEQELHSKQVLEQVQDSKQGQVLELGSKLELVQELHSKVLVQGQGSKELELVQGSKLEQELGSTSVHASSSSKKTISCEVACSKLVLEPGKLACSSEKLTGSL